MNGYIFALGIFDCHGMLVQILKEQLQCLCFPMPCCKAASRITSHIASVPICTAVLKKLRECKDVAMGGGQQKGRVAPHIRCLDRCAGVNQVSDDCAMTVASSCKKRSQAVRTRTCAVISEF